MTGFSAIIPAAGNSGRMGSDKALLALRNGLSMADHLVKNYTLFGASPVVLIINRNLDQSKLNTGNAVCVINDHVFLGRSYSIQLGIRNVPEGHACFIQNVDNPFIGKAILEQLPAAMERDGYVVPVCNGKGGHPVLLGRDVVDFLREQKQVPDFKEVLKRFKRIEVPFTDERILWNINTTEDYRRLLSAP